jgi:hypothetical protein
MVRALRISRSTQLIPGVKGEQCPEEGTRCRSGVERGGQASTQGVERGGTDVGTFDLGKGSSAMSEHAVFRFSEGCYGPWVSERGQECAGIRHSRGSERGAPLAASGKREKAVREGERGAPVADGMMQLDTDHVPAVFELSDRDSKRDVSREIDRRE